MGGGCCVTNCCVMACCVGQVFGCCIGDTIKTIVNDIADIGKRGSSEVASHERYTQSTATVASTVSIQEALTKFQIDTESRSTKLETSIISESRENLDAFIKEIQKYNDTVRYGKTKLNINIRYIERENRKTEDIIHGFIVKRVKEKVSLGDEECKEILAMDAGNAKKERMEEFYKKVLKTAIKDLSEELKKIMEEQTERVCTTIQQRIDSIVDVCESKTEEFEKIRQVKESDEQAVEQEQLRLSHFVAMCEYGLETLDMSDAKDSAETIYA